MADNLSDVQTLCGWGALLDALTLINEKDPQFRLKQIDAVALERFICRRREQLMEHLFAEYREVC